MKPSAVSDLLYSQLQFRAQRQKVISSNIANINTPGYKTKDLSFKDLMNKDKQGDLKLFRTNSRHISPSDSSNKGELFKTSVYKVKGLDEQNDGNNVSLDKQMSKMAKNTVVFQALQGSIKKDANWLSAVISSSNKI